MISDKVSNIIKITEEIIFEFFELFVLLSLVQLRGHDFIYPLEQIDRHSVVRIQSIASGKSTG